MAAQTKWIGMVAVAAVVAVVVQPRCHGQVKAWEGTITIPTYPWEDDINPKFWALEGPARLSTTLTGAITYPYTMQDHLSRTKVERTYKALFLENEYLKVTCLPELGGRLHAVLDKTEGKDMFHRNSVIKPGMIAMRGAWISGGVEWNTGPHGHTVTILAPVDALTGTNPDGSAFLEINNHEKIFRTRWTVRVTLRPGRKYLEESIRIYNPTDGMHPYYFWNCTAFPNRPGTRFIYPMSLGTDHHGRKFFQWPVHEGKDLSWLKNYETYASVFAVDCRYDFFGAYDVDADRGIVQVANRHVLPGKKAWTWGTWDFGLVAQQSLTDEDGPYIEVQSGPLPTQSDYGMLAPRHQIAWKEFWYPLHGLGDGFEFATRDVAVQTSRQEGDLTVRMIATGKFPQALCTVAVRGGQAVRRQVDLSPQEAVEVCFPDVGGAAARVSIVAADGRPLARFTTPLPIPRTTPPERPAYIDKADDQLTTEEKYLKGRRFDRSTDRIRARRYYQMVLADDPGYTRALRALAVLDFEAGLYADAAGRLEKALGRDGDDGLAWYLLGVCRLAQDNPREAAACGYRAARLFATRSLGHDLVGRAAMRLKRPRLAVRAFTEAVRHNPDDTMARDHLLVALASAGRTEAALERAEKALKRRPTDLVPRALLGLLGGVDLEACARQTRHFVGEDDFEMIETALLFADLGLYDQAARWLRATCVDPVPEDERSPLPLYYLAWFTARAGDHEQAAEHLKAAARIWRDFVFPSRTEAIPVLQYALDENPNDARAHLHLGNLLGNLGRMEEAIEHWQLAAQGDPSLSVASRNLGLATWAMEQDAAKASDYYRKAIAARPDDQTLYRDLAEILIASDRRPEAIRLLESMPLRGHRRSDVTIFLAQAYLDEKRYDQTIQLLESTPYFVNWEGQDITWVLFHKAHLERGRQRYADGDYEGAVADFQAALTYPENLGVGRSNRPQEAAAEYWLGRSLQAVGRLEEARRAFQRGAAGCEGSEEQNKHRKLCQEALEELP